MHFLKMKKIIKFLVYQFLFIVIKTTATKELGILTITKDDGPDNLLFALEETPGAGTNSTPFTTDGSMHTLERLSFWASIEEEIVQAVDKKINLIDEEAELISRYIKDYEESSSKAFANANNPNDTSEQRGHIIGSSAVLSHLMTNRFASTINALRELWMSTEYQDVQDNFNRLLEVKNYSNDFLKWPNSGDQYISHFAITQMQEVHNDEPEHMYVGATFNTTFGGQFEAVHCAKLGVFALNRGLYAIAIKWFEFALKRLEAEETESIPVDIVVAYLNLAIQQHNSHLNINWTTAVEFIDAISNCFMKPIYANDQHRTDGRYGLAQIIGTNYLDSTHSGYHMMALCKNEEFQPESVRLKLSCYRYYGGNPYFIINPLNAEQLSESPPIVQYYNVLSENLMQELIATRGELKLSKINYHDDEEKAKSLSSRSSAGIALPEKYSRKIWELTHRLTGLVGMEPTQTVEYVFGRLYWDHFDSHSQLGRIPTDKRKAKFVENEGDRLATVLYYVDVPVDGGNTPFCEVGISLRPVRGAGVFWFSLYRNGLPRFDVGHGACPVLHGHKTIINQWIRYNANFDTFKCSLDSSESHL